MAKLRSFSCKRLSLATFVWYVCLPLTLYLRLTSPGIAQVCHFVSGNNSATFKEVEKKEVDTNGNMILYLPNKQIYTIPPGFQADCDDKKYHRVPILTPTPKDSPPSKEDSKADTKA